MNCLVVRLSGGSGPVGHVNADTERPHNVHVNETWRRLQSHNDDKTGPTASLTPLTVQMLGFTRNLEPVMGGPTEHPTGVTLASGDPLTV